ncbi:serine dehydratase beta chain-domain-containing protein [Russula ochroleuca]|uniref:Serine dehydratase beta chain-domain-containing protein n=1 Tax=Russula ochroleuca TaxID=152965 RepID=A0A9P5MVH3_9AGAM|nr:serine dehydratase beta chain-domain-containing protein [Russula ochroleuca]
MRSFGPCWIAARYIAHPPYPSLRLRSRIAHQLLSGPPSSRNLNVRSLHTCEDKDSEFTLERGPERPEHAVISTFDLFSIGVGPSSSHTVGPMRAGKIFINDLLELGLLEKVRTVKISLYVFALRIARSAKLHCQIWVTGCDRKRVGLAPDVNLTT